MLIWKSLATAIGALALAMATYAPAQQSTSTEGDTAAAAGVEPPEGPSQMEPAGYHSILQHNAEAVLGQQVVDDQGAPLGEAVAVAKDDQDNIVLVVEQQGEQYAIPAEDVRSGTPDSPDGIAYGNRIQPFDSARYETVAEATDEDVPPEPIG